MFIELLKENKKLLITILIFIILILFFNIFTKEKDKNKLVNSENYVYTYKEKEKSILPYININSKEVQDINLKNLETYIKINKQKNRFMKYEYYESKDILSLLVKIFDTEGNNIITIYNIDLKNKKILTNQEILNKFNLTANDVNNILEKYLKKYYQYEKQHNYIDNTCDLDCYRNFNTGDITKDYSLYVKESKLYVYKKLQTTPNFFYDTNMPLPLYHFPIN